MQARQPVPSERATSRVGIVARHLAAGSSPAASGPLPQPAGPDLPRPGPPACLTRVPPPWHLRPVPCPAPIGEGGAQPPSSDSVAIEDEYDCAWLPRSLEPWAGHVTPRSADIIVGAGSAGCAVAARLSEGGAASVLLVESGCARPTAAAEQISSPHPQLVNCPLGYGDLQQSEVDWAFRTAPQLHMRGRASFWPRGKLLGGSSSLNAMLYARGADACFDQWAALGCTGWDAASLLPYFARSEHCTVRGASRRHGVGGELQVSDSRDLGSDPHSTRFVDGAAEAGIPRTADYNGPSQFGAREAMVRATPPLPTPPAPSGASPP